MCDSMCTFCLSNMCTYVFQLCMFVHDLWLHMYVYIHTSVHICAYVKVQSILCRSAVVDI